MSQFKPYPAYKDSGVEWLGEVPENWTVCKLNFRYSVELGKMLDEKRITNTSPLPYLRNQDVQWGKINTDDLPEMDIHPVEMERYTIRSGDLLVCEGGDVGRAAIWRSEDSALGYQKALHRLRHRYAHVDTAEFFYFVLLAAKLRGVFEESESKSTIAHLPAEKFRQYRFVFPPLPDQLTIAAYLNHETARIDALIEEQQRLIELLKEKRQAVISHAVTKGLDPSVPMKDSGVEWLGKVPAHWSVGALGYFAEIDTGATPDRSNPSFWGGNIPWIKTGEVNYENISQAEEYITSEGVNNSAAKVAPKGTLLMAMYGQGVTRGRVAILDFDAAYNQACAGIFVDKRIRVEFLRLFFMAAYPYIRDGGNEASQMNLSSGYIAKIKITAPPLDDQLFIEGYLDSEITRFDSLIAEADFLARHLQERRSALISAAVTGKIDLRSWQPPTNTPAPLREQETV